MYATPKAVILSEPSLSIAKARRHEGSMHSAPDDDAVRTTPSLRSFQVTVRLNVRNTQGCHPERAELSKAKARRHEGPMHFAADTNPPPSGLTSPPRHAINARFMCRDDPVPAMS